MYKIIRLFVNNTIDKGEYYMQENDTKKQN